MGGVSEQGVVYYVTLEDVIEPAQPATSLETPPAGLVLVGVGFKISNASGRGSDYAYKDATSSVPMASVTYQSVGKSGCNNFNNGRFNLAPTEAVLGSLFCRPVWSQGRQG